MEDLPVEVLRNSLQSIDEIARCALCLESVRPEVAQCVRGHLLCGECKRTVTTCPTCKQPFSVNRTSPVLCQIIQALPRRCRHTNCRMYLTVDDWHEKWCGLQMVRCRNTGCVWTGHGQDLLAHIKTNKSLFIFKESNPAMHFPDFDSNIFSNCYFPIVAHGQFFWGEATCDRDRGLFAMKFELVPNGVPWSDYLIEVSFSSEDCFSQSKFRFDWDQGLNSNTVYVPIDLLPNFVDLDGRLFFKIFIEVSDY